MAWKWSLSTESFHTFLIKILWCCILLRHTLIYLNIAGFIHFVSNNFSLPFLGAVSFTLDISSNNTDYDVTVQSAVNSYVMENLVPGGWYVVTVTSFGANNRNNPTPSDELVFQTAPLPPSNIEVTQVATDRISLSWDAVLGNLLN